MRKLLIYLMILFSMSLFANSIEIDNKGLTQNQIEKIETDRDTLTHKVIQVHDPIKTKKENDKIPWIVALIIGGLSAFVNIGIALIQQKSNQRIIDKQLENAKEAIQEQIRNSKEIAMLDFNRSVKSQNRQEWINKLRDLISEIDTKLAHMAFSPIGKTAKGIIEIDLLKNKIDLMLNQSEPEHEALLNSLFTLIAEASRPQIMSADRHKELRNACFNATKVMLKMEWERVKKGE